MIIWESRSLHSGTSYCSPVLLEIEETSCLYCGIARIVEVCRNQLDFIQIAVPYIELINPVHYDSNHEDNRTSTTSMEDMPSYFPPLPSTSLDFLFGMRHVLGSFTAAAVPISDKELFS